MAGVYVGIIVSVEQTCRSALDRVHECTSPCVYIFSNIALIIYHSSCLLQVDHGHEGLLAYTIHPGGVATDMGLRMPSFTHALLTETPELAGDTIAFLTRERREWLAGRYISCECSCAFLMPRKVDHSYSPAVWDMEELLSQKEEIVSGDKLKVRMVV